MSKMSDMLEVLRGGIRPCFVEDDSKSAGVGTAEGSERFDGLLASRLPHPYNLGDEHRRRIKGKPSPSTGG